MIASDPRLPRRRRCSAGLGCSARASRLFPFDECQARHSAARRSRAAARRLHSFISRLLGSSFRRPLAIVVGDGEGHALGNAICVLRSFDSVTALGLSQMQQTDHDVDHGLCPEARNRRAPDVLDGRVTSSEHRTADRTLLVKSARPIWIVRHHDHRFGHRLFRCDPPLWLHAAVDRFVRVLALDDVPDEHRQTLRYEILAGHAKFLWVPPPVANHVVVSTDGTYSIVVRRCYKESFVLVTPAAVP